MQAPADHALWVLNELWNGDKHRAIPVVVANFERQTGPQRMSEVLLRVIDPARVGPPPPPPEFWIVSTLEEKFGPIEDGKPIWRFETSRILSKAEVERHLNYHAKLGFDIAFEKGPPGFGRPVRTELSRISGFVHRLIHNFAEAVDPARDLPAKACPPPCGPTH
jgi:hypothetical protein